MLTGYPDIEVERRDRYLIAPWHGREDGNRRETFADRKQTETGCLVADRRNGRIVELGQATAKVAG